MALLPINNVDYASSLRLAFLTEKGGLGGGETSLLNLLESLVDSGLRPLLLCPQSSLYNEAANLKIDIQELNYPHVHLRMGFIPTFSVKTVLQIFGFLKKYQINLIHAESLLGLYYGGIAAKLCGIPLVATYHGYWPLKSSFNKIFLQHFCKSVFPVSIAMEKEMEVVFKDKNKHIVTLPLGVNNSFFGPLPSKLEARNMLGIPIDRHIVLHVARFQAIKGHHHLIAALDLLIDKMGVHAPIVTFVGGVMEPPLKEELDYKAYVEGLSSQIKVKNNVLFLGQRNDVAQIMRAADIVVCPSDYESFGMAIVEAMVVGTPVIATTAGGPCELIENGKTGLLVEPKDPDALASGIEQILTHPDFGNEMALEAQKIALSRYNPVSRYKALLNVYLQIIGHA